MEIIQVFEAWILKGVDCYKGWMHFLANDITGQQWLVVCLILICISVVVSAIIEARARIRTRTESRHKNNDNRRSGPPILFLFCLGSLFWPFITVIGMVLLPGMVAIGLLHLLYRLAFRLSADEKVLEDKEEITVTLEQKYSLLVHTLIQDNVTIPSLSTLLFSKNRRERVIAKQLLRTLHKD